MREKKARGKTIFIGQINPETSVKVFQSANFGYSVSESGTRKDFERHQNLGRSIQLNY